MPNVKSAIKRHKTSLIRRERNRKRRATMRTFIKKLRAAESPEEATKLLPQVFSSVDKAVKNKVIHPSTGSRYKSRLSKFVDSLGK
ncbi:MAG: 30S ribosomal protein S20 [Candidatus Glassbacteria bacterium]|nr:30S ribosomal protein S20 [Candidatus Glassbacteria bacterium]